METFEFDWELPSGQACVVEADIEPLIPAHINCLPEDAYPAEGGVAYITSITVYGEALKDERKPYVEIDMNNVFVRTPSGKLVDYLDDLGETAYDKWSDQ